MWCPDSPPVVLDALSCLTFGVASGVAVYSYLYRELSQARRDIRDLSRALGYEMVMETPPGWTWDPELGWWRDDPRHDGLRWAVQPHARRSQGWRALLFEVTTGAEIHVTTWGWSCGQAIAHAEVRMTTSKAVTA